MSVGALLLIALVALLQCYSLMRFSGQKVDESEVVAFAVGFFGGDLNPHWFGYGSVPLYLMGMVYLLMGAVGHLFGYVGSVDHYAQLLITNERLFYGSARYVFACIGVTTVFFYGWTMRRLGVPILLVIAYFAVAVSHPNAVGYANFVKTDQFVGLFFSIAVFFLVTAPRGPRTLYVVAAISALALTSKISSAPILALLALASYLNYSVSRDWRPLALALIGLLLLIVVSQPYSNPISVAIRQLTMHASDRVASVVRPHYDNPWDRIAAISAYLWAYYSKLHPAVVALVPFALVARQARSAMLGTLVVLLLVISPFLVASNIQPYWMIPVYPLLAIFPVLGAYGLYLQVSARSVSAGRLVLGVVMMLALGATIKNLLPVISHWTSPTPVTNQTMLEEWVEQNVLGTDIMVLERRHGNLMPRVHDLSSLSTSREASRLFIFNRRQNGFLAETFDKYLVSEYPQRVSALATLPPRRISSLQVRLILNAAAPNEILPPRICLRTRECRPMALIKSEGATLSKSNEGEVVAPTAKRQILDYRLNGDILLDGQWTVELQVKGEAHQPGYVAIGADGVFYPGDRLIIPFSGEFRAPLVHYGDYPWLVNLRDPADLERLPPTPGRRLLLITSPAIYDRYTVLDPNRFKGIDKARVEARQKFYRRLLTSGPPVHRISEGRGPVMEVYDVSGFREALEPSEEGRALGSRGADVIWLKPDAVDACTKAQTVMVHWDASSIDGVRSVEVKTDRGARGEGLFARAGPIGSKATGPWMQAGRQLILRDARNGGELGRVVLKSLPCSGEAR